MFPISEEYRTSSCWTKKLQTLAKTRKKNEVWRSRLLTWRHTARVDYYCIPPFRCFWCPSPCLVRVPVAPPSRWRPSALLAARLDRRVQGSWFGLFSPGGGSRVAECVWWCTRCRRVHEEKNESTATCVRGCGPAKLQWLEPSLPPRGQSAGTFRRSPCY